MLGNPCILTTRPDHSLKRPNPRLEELRPPRAPGRVPGYFRARGDPEERLLPPVRASPGVREREDAGEGVEAEGARGIVKIWGRGGELVQSEAGATAPAEAEEGRREAESRRRSRRQAGDAAAVWRVEVV